MPDLSLADNALLTGYLPVANTKNQIGLWMSGDFDHPLLATAEAISSTAPQDASHVPS